jgi:hypothetical protein
MILGSIRAHSSHAGTSGIRTSEQYRHDASATWIDRIRFTSIRTASYHRCGLLPPGGIGFWSSLFPDSEGGQRSYGIRWLQALATTEIALDTPMTGIIAQALSDWALVLEWQLKRGSGKPDQNCIWDWKSSVPSREVGHEKASSRRVYARLDREPAAAQDHWGPSGRA